MILRNHSGASNPGVDTINEGRGFRRAVRALVGMALAGSLAAMAVAAPASAATIFDYTGTVQTYVVPVSGIYSLLAQGAQGGSAGGALAVNTGELGAMVGGKFTLTAGEMLTIIVGGVGGSRVGSGDGAGGGGGTFILAGDLSPLVIAAGGGGAGNEPLGYGFNGGYGNEFTLGYGGGGAGNSGSPDPRLA